MIRWLLTVVIGLAVAAAVAGAARADGLPVVGIDAGPGGVPAPDGNARYVTLPAGTGTVVAKVGQEGGEVIRSRFLRGRFAVPVVALDGSAAGVSSDGGTLVLVRPRATFPRATTSFAVLDANRLRAPQRITLDGDFSFDALSPDGDLLYLIEYVAPKDPNRYQVRAFDLGAGRLLPAPIVDPREPDEAMRGLPITRATSIDGRFAYTLYDGGGGHPFVHALDTSGRTAACIDLDALAGRSDLYELRLDTPPDGRALEVVAATGPVAVIDTTTFAVSEPTAPPASSAEPAALQPVAAPEPSADAVDGYSIWPLVAGAVGLVAVMALIGLALGVRRRRARPAPG
jgi:hypothetical protein